MGNANDILKGSLVGICFFKNRSKVNNSQLISDLLIIGKKDFRRVTAV